MSIASMIERTGSRATFKTLDEEVGDGGRLYKTWVTVYDDVPCALIPIAALSGREILEYDREKAFAEYKVYIEYRSGITTRHRVYVDGREFDVKRVDDFDSMNIYLRIYVKEITED